jgi:alpha-1,2-mannosyltransferase
MQAYKRRWPFWFLVAALGARVLLIAISALGEATPLTADPTLYQQAMQRMFSGEIPYIDFAFEHLPLSIVPMAVDHAISAATGISFAIPYTITMLTLVFLTGVLVVRIAGDLELGDVGLVWVVMTAPMLVIIPYRVDALSVLLAIAALSAAIRESEGTSMAAAIGGILAKGWPVVLAGTDWWRGRRQRAFVLIGFTAAMAVTLLATPGFREGRSFVGVHEETLSGTLVIAGRLLFGHDLLLTNSAGAVYVETGIWAMVLNIAVGAAVAVPALAVLRRPFTWSGGLALTGALTFAVLLASPLLSTQFLLWPIPFVALIGDRRSRGLLTATVLISVVLTGVWQPGEAWWHIAWLIRNVVLVAAAASTVLDARAAAVDYVESTSLKNLPV